MSIIEAGPVDGVLVIGMRTYPDDRGWFCELSQESSLKEHGIDMTIRQVNYSNNWRGVVRGLHFQKAMPQAKLVTVLRGEVFDVVVDMRLGSATFGKYLTITLEARTNSSLYIPAGCAHGFQALQDNTVFHYLCDQVYSSPDDQGGIHYLDPSLNIHWPLKVTEVSDKDRKLPLLREFSPADYPFITPR